MPIVYGHYFKPVRHAIRTVCIYSILALLFFQWQNTLGQENVRFRRPPGSATPDTTQKIYPIPQICLYPGIGNIPSVQWGQDCTNWIVYSEPWGPVEAIYDPLYGSGGGWRARPTCSTPISWPALDVELWIEMECVFWFENTSVDIHLASSYDDVCVSFYGTSSCNNAQSFLVTPPPGESLNFLPFVEDVLGRQGAPFGSPIPASWQVSLDGGDFLPMNGDPQTGLTFSLEPCDHSYYIKLCLDIQYHQDDGYYSWSNGGYLCTISPF